MLVSSIAIEVRNKVISSNIGKLLTAKNKRNTKNKDKLNALKLSPEIKLLLKDRASQTLFEPQVPFRHVLK